MKLYHLSVIYIIVIIDNYLFYNELILKNKCMNNVYMLYFIALYISKNVLSISSNSNFNQKRNNRIRELVIFAEKSDAFKE